jgi:glycosyltransferase involved in cell wall biosynthesis
VSGEHPEARPAIPLRLHLTNVTGLGAAQLAGSLLPAFERCDGCSVEQIYLPDQGPVSGYVRCGAGPDPIRYRRRIPRGVSRMLECTLFAGAFDGPTPMLVLGDLPLRSKGPQVVFVQSPLLIPGGTFGSRLDPWRRRLSRAVFRANRARPAAFIVQTPTMRRALADAYPDIAERIHVVAQPPPEWLRAAGLKRSGRTGGGKLRLIYPAADYAHKNHALLATAWASPILADLIADLILTAPPARSLQAPWIRRLGRLDAAAMVRAYREVDALLFLSKAESYGFPLVEAMWIGLPIVCPDLPYSRDLCGDGAIYFDPDDLVSLGAALSTLRDRLAGGWWPDWSAPLRAIPDSWDEVARQMLAVVEQASCG